MHEPRGVHLAAAVKRTVMTAKNAVMPSASRRLRNSGRAIQLEHADFARLNRTPQRPVADPVDLIGECAITREVQKRQRQRVSCVSVLRDRLHQDHKARPDQDRRHQQQPPEHEERPEFDADFSLDHQHDQPGRGDRQYRPRAQPRLARCSCPARASRRESAWHRRSRPAASTAPARATRPCKTTGAGRGK